MTLWDGSYQQLYYGIIPVYFFPWLTLDFLPNHLLSKMTLWDGSYQQLYYGIIPVGANPVPLIGIILGSSTYLYPQPYNNSSQYGLGWYDSNTLTRFGAQVIDSSTGTAADLDPLITPVYLGVFVYSNEEYIV
jgi:hypothetical protein